MEHINETMNRTMRKSCGDLAAKPAAIDNDEIITRLFAVLGVLYGSKWTSLIQNEISENAARLVWGKALAGIDVHMIKKALDWLPIELPNWPPTVGQFIAICKIGHDPAMMPALPKPRGDEKIGLAALEEMQRIIKANKGEVI